MRTAIYVLSLALSLSVAQAAPISELSVSTGPSFFSHDPYSIHRRSTSSSSSASLTKRNMIAGRDDAGTLAELEAEDNLETEISLAACSTECGVIKIEGVKSEKEALCSGPGLEATKKCAQCIDTTWPDTRFQESAMSEYNKLVALCDNDA